MTSINLSTKKAYRCISETQLFRKISRKPKISEAPDIFVPEQGVPKRLKTILDKLGTYDTSERKFLTDLYSTGQQKFEYIYTNEAFQSSIPYFCEKPFIDTVKNITEQELKTTFDEITNLYKTLPKVSYDYDKATQQLIYEAQTPNARNYAQLTILKNSNKELYESILNNPDKESVSEILNLFENKMEGSVFTTLTDAQFGQIIGRGTRCKLNPKTNDLDRKILMNGLAAEGQYVEYSDSFYHKPEQITNLNRYLSAHTIEEPFTAYRAERDTGMFNSVILDSGMSRKVKFLVLKNMFKAKKVKVHDYTERFDNFEYTDLFSHIMNKKELTLADAMQVAKYGNKNFRAQVIELIKKSQIQDNRFKSLTFDSAFANSWSFAQNNNTRILQNMSVDRGLHGRYSSVNNRQAEFILNNDPKVMSFQDVKYNPENDVFYFDSTIQSV